MLDRAADMFFRDVTVAFLRTDAHPFLFTVGVLVIDFPIRNPHDDMAQRALNHSTARRPAAHLGLFCSDCPIAMRIKILGPLRQNIRRTQAARHMVMTVPGGGELQCPRQLAPQGAVFGIGFPLPVEFFEAARLFQSVAHIAVNNAEHELAIALLDGCQQAVAEASPRRIACGFVARHEDGFCCGCCCAGLQA